LFGRVSIPSLTLSEKVIMYNSIYMKMGYICDGTCWNAVPEVLRKTQDRTALQNLFFLTSISNTSPSLSAYWFTTRSGPYFLWESSTNEDCHCVEIMFSTSSMEFFWLHIYGFLQVIRLKYFDK
jgi:hypothetical protein